jgi:long-chain acyl-CoA synthetase
MSLAEALRNGRQCHPDKPALLFEERSGSYAQLDEVTDRIGAALLRHGVRPGDRVALLFTNCPEMVFGYYACFKIGAVAVPLNFRLQAPEVEYILNHCGARFLLGQEDLFQPVQSVRANLPCVEQCFLTGDAAAFPGVRPFTELLARPANATAFPEVTPDMVAAILYTSGTTAHPKGVTHTHATLARQASDMIASGDMRPDDILAIATPLCHASGFQCHLLPAISLGAAVLVIPRPDPAAVLQAMARHRATWFLGLPVLCNNLIQTAASAFYDLSALRVCMAAGDAVTPELQRRFRATFGVEVAELWGMTEIVPGCANPITGTKKVGSIGLPAPSVSLRLATHRGLHRPPGEVGEIPPRPPRPRSRTAGCAPATWRAWTPTATTGSSAARRRSSSAAAPTSPRWKSKPCSPSIPPCKKPASWASPTLSGVKPSSLTSRAARECRPPPRS